MSPRTARTRSPPGLAAIAANKEELEAAYKTIDADKERIQAQLAEKLAESHRQALAALEGIDGESEDLRRIADYIYRREQ